MKELEDLWHQVIYHLLNKNNMAQFTRIGGAYFRQDNSGELFAVSDPDTLKGLKLGQLPFNSVENTRGLSFATPEQTKNQFMSQDSAPTNNKAPEIQASANTSQSGVGATSDFKQQLIDTLMKYKGVTDTSQLEMKRQELLRQQMLSAPYSEEGDKNLTAAGKLSLMRSRGSQFEPEIQSLEQQIVQAKQGDEMAIANLQKVASIAKDLGMFGETEDAKHSPIYYEWQDAKDSGYTGDLNQYMNEDANRKNVAAGGGGLSPATLTKITSIAQAHDSNQIVKDYMTVQNKAGSMQRILDSGVGGPGDLALVFDFMKSLDPNSVVRESEYATAAKSGNIFKGVFAKFNGYLKEEGGFLPDTVQNAFVSIMKTKLDVVERQYNNYHQEQARKINNLTGLNDGIDYLTDYGKVDMGFDEITEETKVVNGQTYVKVEGGWQLK